MTLTQLGIYQITFEGHVGITSEERDTPQPIVVDVELTGAIKTASDDLKDTLDYDAIARKILIIGQTSRVNLMETLADRMADAVLADPQVESVSLRVKKCHPPLKEICGGFVVTITRSRER